MITQLSIKIADFFLRKDIIAEDLKLVYQVGFDVLISTFIQCASIIGIGFLLGDPGGALLFLLCFMTIRAYSGGFHAKTRNQCLLFMLLSYCFSNMTGRFVTHFSNSVVIWLMCFLCLFVKTIFLKLAPIKNDRKILPTNWRVDYRKKMFGMIGFWDLVIVFLIRNHRHFSLILLMGQVAAAVFVILGAYKNQKKKVYVNRNEEQINLLS